MPAGKDHSPVADCPHACTWAAATGAMQAVHNVDVLMVLVVSNAKTGQLASDTSEVPRCQLEAALAAARLTRIQVGAGWRPAPKPRAWRAAP